jgi:hypothetical protein
MKVEIKEIYKCDFCNKLYQVKRFAEYHEKGCSKNPENERPCFNCHNMEKRETEITGNYYNGSEWERKVDLFYCKAKNIFLHTPKNELKGNAFELGDDLNEPMPKLCNVYKEQSFDLDGFDLLNDDMFKSLLKGCV